MAHGILPGTLEGTSPMPAEPVPEAVLLVSGHAAGWLTPSGCAGTQAGGVARRAGYGQLLRKTYPGVPVWYLDQGGAIMLDDAVQRAATEAVLGAMTMIRYAAVNVGRMDLGASRGDAEFIERSIQVPRLSANLAFDDNGEPAFAPYLILTVPARPGEGGAPSPLLRIAVLGVVDDRYDLFKFGPGGRSLVAASVADTLALYVAQARAKADVVILLADASPSIFQDLLRQVHGIDLVVAGEGSHVITNPMMIEGVPLIAVGNQGKFLAEVRVFRKEGRPALAPFVHWLDERFPEDPALSRLAEEAIDAINEATKKRIEADAAPNGGIAPYAGAGACAKCHEDAYRVWKESKHASATQELVRLKRDFTVSCLPCHVTGSGPEGAFQNLHSTPGLAGVQCEECHGAGAGHIADSSRPYGAVREAACQACHTPASDPSFTRDARWSVIKH